MEPSNLLNGSVNDVRISRISFFPTSPFFNYLYDCDVSYWVTIIYYFFFICVFNIRYFLWVLLRTSLQNWIVNIIELLFFVSSTYLGYFCWISLQSLLSKIFNLFVFNFGSQWNSRCLQIEHLNPLFLMWLSKHCLQKMCLHGNFTGQA